MKYLVFISTVLLLLAGCTATVPTENTQEETTEISAAATFYPYYDLTRSVIGDLGEVISVVPPAVEPHNFEPSARDYADLQNVKVYVSTGVEFENFEEKIISSLAKDTIIVQSSEGITLLQSTGDHDHESEEHEEEEEEHVGEEEHEEGTDPHVWLSPKNAMMITQTISEALQEAYPELQAQLQANTQASIAALEELHTRYESELATCNKDTILVAHNAYQYLAKDYGFDVIAVSGLSPESEPTPGQLVDLIEEARYHNITVVYFEELVDPRVSETIAAEVGAQTMRLNPVAGSSEGKSYIEIMDDNLDKLKLGLDCS